MNDEEEANTSKDSPQPIEGGHDLSSYDAPPPRPEGSNIAGHAWDELNRAGAFTAEGDFYGGMTGRAVGGADTAGAAPGDGRRRVVADGIWRRDPGCRGRRPGRNETH